MGVVGGLSDFTEGGLDFGHTRGFADESIDGGGYFFFAAHHFAPTGHHDDGGGWGDGFDPVGEFGAIHDGHAEVGDDDIDGVTFVAAGMEDLEGFGATVGTEDFMAIGFEDFAYEFTEEGFVIDVEDAEFCIGAEDFRGGGGLIGWVLAGGEDEADGGAFTGLGFDFDTAFVAFDGAIDHGEAEAGATFSFGGVEGVEAVLADFFGHAGAGIADFEDGEGGGCFWSGEAGWADYMRGEREVAALGQGIDGIEDEVG